MTDFISCDACHLDSGQARLGLARPGARAPFSRHLLKVSPLSTLAGLRRRRRRHPRPRTHFRTCIIVERKMAVNSIVNGRCEFEGVRIDSMGYASRLWMGSSIEPLVVGVGVLIEQGDDTAKFVGLKGG